MARRLRWDVGFAAPLSPLPAPAADDVPDPRLAEAWQAGHDAGVEAGRALERQEATASADAACAVAIDHFLAETGRDAAALRGSLEDVAATTARTAILALQALLPATARRFAAAEAESLVAAAILASAGRPTLAVSAAPDLQPALALWLEGRPVTDGPAVLVMADGSLPPGTIAARWDGGSAHWHMDEAAAGIGAALERLLKDLDDDRSA